MNQITRIIHWQVVCLFAMVQGAWAEGWTEVSNAPQLNNAIANGARIRLTADITLLEYLKIGQSGKQAVEIDLNNHTLKRTGRGTPNRAELR